MRVRVWLPYYISIISLTHTCRFYFLFAGVPLIYELDDDLKPIKHPDAIAPLSGHYLGDQEQIKQRIGAVMAQTK
jgi:hypothetical protein